VFIPSSALFSVIFIEGQSIKYAGIHIVESLVSILLHFRPAIHLFISWGPGFSEKQTPTLADVSPARIPSVLCVGASNINDAKWSKSRLSTSLEHQWRVRQVISPWKTTMLIDDY